jgi:O-antigen ligase
MSGVLRWMQRPHAARTPLLILLLSVGMAVLVSPLPGRSAQALWPLLVGLCAYWALGKTTLSLRAERHLWRALILVAGGLCLLAVLGMPPPQHPLWRRLGIAALFRQRFPETFNANVLAGALTLLAPFGVAGIVRPRLRGAWVDVIERAATISITAIMVLGLLLTESRGAYMVGAVSLVALVALGWPRALRWLLPAILLVAVLVVAVIGWRPIVDALLIGDKTRGLDQRVEIWSRAVNMIADFPITGVGLGCFEPVMRAMYPLFLIAGGAVSHAHNLYLQIGVDLGVTGLAAWLAILALALRAAWAARARFRVAQERDEELLCVACLASLAGMSLHGIIDCVVWGNKGAFLLWIVLGLSMALGRVGTTRANSPQST